MTPDRGRGLPRWCGASAVVLSLAVAAAIVLGILEALAAYVLGVRYSFAILLLLVIAVLIWRPYGLFGRRQVVRL